MPDDVNAIILAQLSSIQDELKGINEKLNVHNIEAVKLSLKVADHETAIIELKKKDKDQQMELDDLKPVREITNNIKRLLWAAIALVAVSQLGPLILKGFK